MAAFISPTLLSNFRTMIRKIAPPWLLGFTGERYLYTLGIFTDAIADASMYSVAARFPQSFIPGALIYQSRDRGIDRGPSETDTVFAGRLRDFRATWRIAGSPHTLLRQVQAYFYPATPVIEVVWNPNWKDASPVNNFGVWFTIDAAGNITKTLGSMAYNMVAAFNWGDNLATWPTQNRFFRFWVVVHVASGSLMLPASYQSDLRTIVDKWTRPGTICDTIIQPDAPTDFTATNPIATAGTYWNPANRTNPNTQYY